MADYTPTTEDVRLVWSAFHVRASGTVRTAVIKANEQFARWLTEHDRAVKAEGWDEGHSVGWMDAVRSEKATALRRNEPDSTFNPYRADPTEGTRV